MSSLALEFREIDLEYQALESEMFLDSFNDSTDVVPYDIATEVAHSTFQAKVQNRLRRIGEWFKKLFAALPKLFAKVVNYISHSQLVTKARLRKELPKDFKELPKDKLRIVKDLRLQILTAKNQLLDASNKKMETALKLMEAASSEMSDIANIIRVGDTSRQDVIEGRVDVSKDKIEKMENQCQQLESDETCKNLRGKINELINKLQNLLENETIFEVAVPSCKGENKATYYANKIKDDCDKWSKLAKLISNMIQNTGTTLKGEFHGAVAGHYNSKTEDGQELGILERHLQRKSANIADAENLSKAAKSGSSNVLGLVNVYSRISSICTTISKDYSQSMAICYKVYGNSDSGTKQVYNNEVASSQSKDDETGKAKPNVYGDDSKLEGELKWNDQKGCWSYNRIIMNEGGNFVESHSDLVKYKDKDHKPPISKELLKEIESALAKNKQFKRFANEGDREALNSQHYYEQTHK